MHLFILALSPDFPTTNIVWRVRDLGEGLKVIDMQVERVLVCLEQKEMILKWY